MKNLIYKLFFLFYSNIKAQNLVPYSGFEQYGSCPSGVYELSKATGWIQPNIEP
jgi:hypothetical protein